MDDPEKYGEELLGFIGFLFLLASIFASVYIAAALMGLAPTHQQVCEMRWVDARYIEVCEDRRVHDRSRAND